MSPRSALHHLGARFALRRCDVVGDGVVIHGRPSIENRGRLEIGAGTVIASRPVAAQLATGPDGSLLIGERVAIGYGASIVAKGLVAIGAGTQIGPFAMICDAEDDGLSGWRHSERPIVVGRDVRLGSKVTLLPGTYIADGVHVPPGAVVSGSVGVQHGAQERKHRAPQPPDAGVASRVAEILSQIFDRPPDAPLSLELERISGWGAGAALRLVTAVEHEFKTRIPDDEWLAIRSFGDLVDAIERRTPSGGGSPAPQDIAATQA